MRTYRHATVILLVAALAGAPPVLADEATAPATDARAQKEATRSRSNVQNNRETSAPAPADPATGAEPAEVQKTKTRSNQSND